MHTTYSRDEADNPDRDIFVSAQNAGSRFNYARHWEYATKPPRCIRLPNVELLLLTTSTNVIRRANTPRAHATTNCRTRALSASAEGERLADDRSNEGTADWRDSSHKPRSPCPTFVMPGTGCSRRSAAQKAARRLRSGITGHNGRAAKRIGRRTADRSFLCRRRTSSGNIRQ